MKRTFFFIIVMMIFVLYVVFNNNNEANIINNEAEKIINEVDALIVENGYYDAIDIDDRRKNIITSMIKQTGDEYAEYIESDEHNIKTQSNFVPAFDYVVANGICEITNVYQPMDSNGIVNVGDLIISINGESIYNFTIEHINQLLSGKQGTTVELLLMDVHEDIYHLIVERNTENNHEFISLYEDKILYIKIMDFNSVIEDKVVDAFRLINENASGIILDLRGNPGGNVEVMRSVAQYFLPNGLMEYFIDKNGNRTDVIIENSQKMDLPLVVLVDKNTASAAESFVAAVKELHVGTVIGETTAGKGIAQQIFKLSNGDSVKLTTSYWYTPSGKNYHKIGIVPDIEIKHNLIEIAKDIIKTN